MFTHSHLNCKINIFASRIYVVVERLDLHIGSLLQKKKFQHIWEMLCMWDARLDHDFCFMITSFFTFMEQKKILFIFKTGKYCVHIKFTTTATMPFAYAILYFVLYTRVSSLSSYIRNSHRMWFVAWTTCIIYIKLTSVFWGANWCTYTWTYLIRSIKIYGLPGINWSTSTYSHENKRNSNKYYRKFF